MNSLFVCMTILMATASPDSHTIRSGNMTAVFTPQAGLTSLQVGDQTLFQGATAMVGGRFYSLTRHVEQPREWNWPTTRNSNYFGVSLGTMTGGAGPSSQKQIEVLTADEQRFTVRHRYEGDIEFIFDHQVNGPDVTIRVTINNDSQDLFQLYDWIDAMLLFEGGAEHFQRMGSYYPAANIYSPVTAIWNNHAGLGLNWVEHRFRPVEMRLHPQRNSNARWQFRLWLKNSPVEPGGRSRYTLVMRADQTPGDWKHLLTPYKTWFNAYMGPSTYRTDFRMKVASFAANAALGEPGNPLGFRHNLHTEGWFPYIRARLTALRDYDVSHVIIWAATGASPRGVNYRPEFNVFPPAAENSLPLLREFCNRVNTGFGFFARPNTIAFQENQTEDADVEWNPLDGKHIAMADRRFRDLLEKGATAFYLDTYGSSVGTYPMSAEGMVYYLKHLRALAGPECLIFTEHGFDAMHLFAAIWPSSEDDLGKRPFGEYARWLAEGTVEIVRVKSAEGARRAWAEGGVPIFNDSDLSAPFAELQRQFVRADGSSIARPDCPPPNRAAK